MKTAPSIYFGCCFFFSFFAFDFKAADDYAQVVPPQRPVIKRLTDNLPVGGQDLMSDQTTQRDYAPLESRRPVVKKLIDSSIVLGKDDDAQFSRRGATPPQAAAKVAGTPVNRMNRIRQVTVFTSITRLRNDLRSQPPRDPVANMQSTRQFCIQPLTRPTSHTTTLE